jgi:hypothetical protein
MRDISTKIFLRATDTHKGEWIFNFHAMIVWKLCRRSLRPTRLEASALCEANIGVGTVRGVKLGIQESMSAS